VMAVGGVTEVTYGAIMAQIQAIAATALGSAA